MGRPSKYPPEYREVESTDVVYDVLGDERVVRA